MKMHVRHGKTRRAIELGDYLGKGAEGIAYQLAQRPDTAAKIYFQNEPQQVAHMPQRQEKILTMLASPPRVVSVSYEGAVVPLLAWPTHLVETDDKTFSGFLMPTVPEARAMPLTEYLKEIAAPTHLSELERCLTSRLSLCRSLAGVMADLHSQGHYVVDFKPLNLRVFHKSCLPCLLDNDGFSITGKNGRRFPATAYSPDYACPELLERNAADEVDDDAQDRFALAVLIFQILNKGIHPFQGVLAVPDDEATSIDMKILKGLYAHGLEEDPRVRPRPGSDHDCLPRSTRLLFDRAFKADVNGDRPSANDWRRHFDELRARRPFAKCEKHPESMMHIHFVGLPCTECRRDALLAEHCARVNTAAENDKKPRHWGRFVLIGAGLLVLWYLLAAS